MGNEEASRVSIEWPNKAIQTLTLERKPDGTLELGVVVLIPFKPHPAAQTAHKAVGVAVPITEAERQAAIAVLEGRKPHGNQLDGENQDSKGAPTVEAHSRDSGNGRPRKPTKKVGPV